MTLRAQRRLSGASLEPLCGPTDAAFAGLLQEVEDEIFMQHNENYELDCLLVPQVVNTGLEASTGCCVLAEGSMAENKLLDIIQVILSIRGTRGYPGYEEVSGVRSVCAVF